MSESKTKDAGLPGGNRDAKNAKARRYMRKGSGPPHFDTLLARFLLELPMIGFREDGFEPLRYKLRTLPAPFWTGSDHELIQFGRELRKKCFKPKEDRCWKELQLAREEWRSRHPKPPRPRR